MSAAALTAPPVIQPQEHIDKPVEKANPWKLGLQITGVVASIGIAILGALAYSNGWLEPVIAFGATVIGGLAVLGPLQIVGIIVGGIIVISLVALGIKLAVEAVKKHQAEKAAGQHPQIQEINDEEAAQIEAEKTKTKDSFQIELEQVVAKKHEEAQPTQDTQQTEEDDEDDGDIHYVEDVSVAAVFEHNAIGTTSVV